MSLRDSRFDHAWHVAINRFNEGKAGSDDWCRWMYSAKDAWNEAPRLALLFKREREGSLLKTHQQCSFSQAEPIVDNHLSCCLGVKCAACPHLAAIEGADLTPEQKDEAKAWTCVGHILSEGGDPANEGFILTVDDRMFWDRTHANMAMSLEDGDEA